MKFLKYTVIVTIFLLPGQSCKKDGNIVNPVPISALTIVNAIVGSNPLIATFSPDSPVAAYYETTPQIWYGAFNEYSLPSAATPCVIFQTTDTVHSEFRSTLALKANTTYSLFLSGIYNAQNNADTLLTVDNIPFYSPSDSVTGVRFVNLSPGSNPISVDLQTAPATMLASNIGYKGVTGFQSFPADANSQNAGYTFEFRDATSDSLLATFPLSIVVFKNQTLAYYGTPAAGLQVMSINNF